MNQHSATISGLSSGEHCSQVQARFTQATPDEILDSNKVCAVPADNDEDKSEVCQVDIEHNWKTVFLFSHFNDPVVMVGVPTYHDVEPGLVKIRNLQSNSFEIQLSKWAYLDGEHGSRDVSYLVAKRGVHEMPDGSIWDAGRWYLGQMGIFDNPHQFFRYSPESRVFCSVFRPVMNLQNQ